MNGGWGRVLCMCVCVCVYCILVCIMVACCYFSSMCSGPRDGEEEE